MELNNLEIFLFSLLHGLNQSGVLPLAPAILMGIKVGCESAIYLSLEPGQARGSIKAHAWPAVIWAVTTSPHSVVTFEHASEWMLKVLVVYILGVIGVNLAWFLFAWLLGGRFRK